MEEVEKEGQLNEARLSPWEGAGTLENWRGQHPILLYPILLRQGEESAGELYPFSNKFSENQFSSERRCQNWWLQKIFQQEMKAAVSNISSAEPIFQEDVVVYILLLPPPHTLIHVAIKFNCNAHNNKKILYHPFQPAAAWRGLNNSWCCWESDSPVHICSHHHNHLIIWSLW